MPYKDPAKRREADRRYERSAGRQATKQRRGARHRQKLREETFSAYGARCLACGETEPCCLTIDHIFDDGAVERGPGPHRRGGWPFYLRLRKAGFPQDRYQLLCHNCQFRKRTYGPNIASWPKPYAG